MTLNNIFLKTVNTYYVFNFRKSHSKQWILKTTQKINKNSTRTLGEGRDKKGVLRCDLKAERESTALMISTSSFQSRGPSEEKHNLPF